MRSAECLCRVRLSPTDGGESLRFPAEQVIIEQGHLVQTEKSPNGTHYCLEGHCFQSPERLRGVFRNSKYCQEAV